MQLCCHLANKYEKALQSLRDVLRLALLLLTHKLYVAKPIKI